MPEIKCREALLDLRREFPVWRPPAGGLRSKWSAPKPKVPREIVHADTPFERNQRTTAETYDRQQGGLHLATELQFNEASLASWKDRQLNPDDYEWEGPTCEDCGESVVFDTTMSGTLTEWCPKCRWVDTGKVFQQMRGPTPGAFGEMSPLRRARRFWSGEGAVTVSRRIFRRPPNRVFVLAPLVPTIIGHATIRPAYANRGSKYSDVISCAMRGDPFVVPVPPDMTPAIFQNRLSGHLRQHKSTHMGRWSVCRVKEGIRIGLIGSWKESA